ncbi:MAG: hypothetical protein JW734_05235 [Candidatus Omnitrophica bacterium]|nr:hypothetical protein [Candidatus Omnitrophota bacterium]
MNKKMCFYLVCMVFLFAVFYYNSAFALKVEYDQQVEKVTRCNVYPNASLGSGPYDAKCNEPDISLDRDECRARMCDNQRDVLDEQERSVYGRYIRGDDSDCDRACSGKCNSICDNYCRGAIDPDDYIELPLYPDGRDNPVYKEEVDECKDDCGDVCQSACEDKCDRLAFGRKTSGRKDSYWTCDIGRVDCLYLPETIEVRPSTKKLPFAPFAGSAYETIKDTCDAEYCCCDVCMDYRCIKWKPTDAECLGPLGYSNIDDCPQECDEYECSDWEKWELSDRPDGREISFGEVDHGDNAHLKNDPDGEGDPDKLYKLTSRDVETKNAGLVHTLPYPGTDECHIGCSPGNYLPEPSGKFDCTYIRATWRTDDRPYYKACIVGHCSTCDFNFDIDDDFTFTYTP